MSEYVTKVHWTRNEAVFTDNRYSRAHVWEFDGGVRVPASSSPHVVRAPYSDPARVDPEEAYVASLSSCHMLWFLSIAAERGFVVEDYVDQAVGVMAKNADGKLVMTRVTLNPQITYAGDRIASDEETQAMHHTAHEACYLANSVKTEIVVIPHIVHSS